MASNSNPILSTVSSLKEVATILTGLTITNAIFQLITPTTMNTIPYHNPQNLSLFTLLIVNVIRFYHGNMRHLDTTYTAEWGKGSSGDLKLGGGKKLAIDFFVIFFQCLVFAILSFFILAPQEYFYIFTALLIVDVFWFLGAYQFTSDPIAFAHQKKWMQNNIFAVIALLFFILSGVDLSPISNIWLLWIIVAINTLADFVVSWNFYFPTYIPEKNDSK